jgi:hypothetical protein
MWIGQPAPTHSSWFVHPGQTPLLPAARVKDDREDDASIIWICGDVARDFHGQTLNRAPVDSALVVWHSDYTEIMSSGRRLAPGDVRGPYLSALRTRSTLSEGVTLVAAASCVNRTIGVRVCQQVIRGIQITKVT